MPGLLIWLTNCYGCSVVDSPSQVKKRDYMNAHRGWSASGASKIFGTVLAALRSIQGVSQRDLADLSGGSVSFSHLRALESGERWPTDKTLINLAAQLGAREISPAFLIQARDKLESLVPRMQRAPGDTEDEMSTAEAICDWLVEVATPAPFDVVRSIGLHQFATVTWVASEHESRTFEVIRVGPSSGWRVVLGGCPPNVPQGTPRRNSEPLELPTSPAETPALRTARNDKTERLLALADQLEDLDLVIAYTQALVDAQMLTRDILEISGDEKR